MTTETIGMRSYAGDYEIPAICALLNACDAVDREDDSYTEDGLRSELTDPRVDLARDVRLWEDDDGRLVGFGQPFMLPGEQGLDAYIFLRVLPEARGQGIEAQILAFNLARIRERAAADGQLVTILASTDARNTAMQALFAAAGGSVVRWGYTLVRDTTVPIAAPVFPDGFVVRGVQPDDAPHWIALYNQSFVDHWHFHALEAETHAHWLSETAYRPDLDLVAVAPDGTFVAFAHCGIDPELNALKGTLDGHVHLLGTRRGWRRQGLGRAMLREAVQTLRDAGMTTVTLGVDAENPSGAVDLYESEGFVEQHRRVTYQLPTE